MIAQSAKINIILSLILKIGAYIGVLFMALGLLLFRGQFLTRTQLVKLPVAFSGILHFDPLSLITIGLLILILTPALRVLAAALTFLLVEKDKKYFLISTGVLILLLLSIAIATQFAGKTV